MTPHLIIRWPSAFVGRAGGPPVCPDKRGCLLLIINCNYHVHAHH